MDSLSTVQRFALILVISVHCLYQSEGAGTRTGTQASFAALNSYFVYIIVSIIVTGGASTPTLGQRYTLSCNVSEAVVTTYHWGKNGNNLNETDMTLTFESLLLSNSGLYTCTVIVNSTSYNASRDITLQS